MKKSKKVRNMTTHKKIRRPQSDQVAHTATAGRINAEAEGATFTINPPTVFVVRGQVRWMDGKPLATAVVQAVDRDLRGEQALGQAQTDKDGRYEICYTPAQFIRAEKNSADLVVRALNAAGGAIAVSPILINAPAEATVDLVVNQATAGMLSEYERIIAELQPLLVNVTIVGSHKPTIIDQLADLKSSDLDFLAAETGIARRKLAILTASAVLEKKAAQFRFDVPAAIFYGLVREGLPADLAALGLVSQQKQNDALERAFKENLIPAALRESIAKLLPQLRQLTVEQALQTPPSAGKPTASQLLNTVMKAPDQQAAFLTAYANHGDQPVEEFWKNLRAQPAFATKVDALQFVLQLGVLTQNHVPLIQELQNTLKVASMRDLVKLDAAAWTALVNKKTVGLPPNVPGDTPEARAANYVNGIMGMLHAAFPTETVVQIVAKAPAINLDDPTRKAVSQFFVNAPDFDVRSTRVDAYVKDRAATAFKGIAEADRPKVIAQVKRTQRLFHVSTSAETLTALMGTGLDSAYAIARVPRKSFLARHAAALGGEEQAVELHQRAAAITTRSLHIYTLLNDALSGAQPRSVTGDGIASSNT